MWSCLSQKGWNQCSLDCFAWTKVSCKERLSQVTALRQQKLCHYLLRALMGLGAVEHPFSLPRVSQLSLSILLLPYCHSVPRSYNWGPVVMQAMCRHTNKAKLIAWALSGIEVIERDNSLKLVGVLVFPTSVALRWSFLPPDTFWNCLPFLFLSPVLSVKSGSPQHSLNKFSLPKSTRFGFYHINNPGSPSSV